MTSAILNQLRSLGWTITERRHYGLVELRATKGEETHVARCSDTADEEPAYPAACELAELCGVDLEDG